MTPEYAAPEQITGAPVTTATDVYALGVLLYVLLTGQHPTGAATHSPAELVKAIVDTEPKRISDVVTPTRTPQEPLTINASQRATTPDKLRRSLLGDLDTIVAKALKKNPEERYSSVTAFGDDLTRYLKHEPISARPDTLIYRTTKFVRRNRTVVALASARLIHGHRRLDRDIAAKRKPPALSATSLSRTRPRQPDSRFHDQRVQGF
jgi:serine/threonine-protein kinase